MDEYNVLMKFIEWCEDTNRTEWMGYSGMAKRVVTEYLDERRNKKSIAHDPEDDDVRGGD